ncbi:MAG: diguanylate cyclase [Clostridia bacterium]
MRMELAGLSKQEALQFSHELLTLYFEKRDMSALACHMQERTSWIGTGEGELCENLAEAGNALSAELTEYDGAFTLMDQSLSFVPLVGAGAMVYGTLRAIPTDKILSDENIRFSAMMEQTRTGPKLVHIHFSHADVAQKKGDYFVKQGVRVDNQSLRAELNLRERQLANLTKNIPGGAHQCATDAALTLLSMSDGFLSMCGYTKEEIDAQFGGQFINMVYPGDRAEMTKHIRAQLQKGPDLEIEYRVLRKRGKPIWVLDRGRLLDDGNGKPCFYCLLIDITQRKRQQEELRLSLERHQVILDQASDIIFEWDILRDTLDFSPNWEKRFGYGAIDRQISGRIPLSANIHPDDMAAFVKIMRDTAAGIPYSEAEFRIRDLAGAYYWCRIRATTQYNADGLPIKAVGVIVDIDEEKKQTQALILQAQYDALTGIYNKATINALVEQRMGGKYIVGNGFPPYHALLIIDVDCFKAVNDTYGHLCGDSVLSDVAAVLKGSVRSSDLVGRIGGDEFLVYLPEVADEVSVRHKAERMMQALSSIRPETGAPPITCSIGVAVLPRGQRDYARFYQTADSALYQRKNSGRDGFTFYASKTGEAAPPKPVTAVGNSIVSDEGNVVDEWLAQYAFRTLYEAKDTEVALNRLLEIIGRSFDVSRAYIFESSEDGNCCSNTFEWCGDGIAPQMDVLQNIAYVDGLGDYLKNFDSHGIFYCHDIKCLHPSVYAILRPQGIRSMIQCAMLDEGAFVGYVGFDECRENRAWSKRQVASFKLTANVLSTFLIKLREKQKNHLRAHFPI